MHGWPWTDTSHRTFLDRQIRQACNERLWRALDRVAGFEAGDIIDDTV